MQFVRMFAHVKGQNEGWDTDRRAIPVLGGPCLAESLIGPLVAIGMAGLEPGESERRLLEAGSF